MLKLSDFRVLTLFVTKKCNLNCEYCYVKQNDSEMSHDIMKYVIDHGHPSSCIDFFGGEPSLRLDFIKDTIEYAHSKEDNNRSFKIFTNGTIFNPQFESLIQNYNLIPRVSFDSVENSERTNTKYNQEIFENMKEFRRIVPNLLVNTSITPYNMKHLIHNVDYLASNGFNFINHFFLKDVLWSDEQLKEFDKYFGEFIDWYVDNYDNVKLLYIDEFAYRIFSQRRNSFCIAGCKTGPLAINTNGDVYPCEILVESPFCMGNIFDGEYTDKFDKVLKNLKNIKQCYNCDMLYQCQICFACFYFFNGSYLMPHENYCQFMRIMFKHFAKLTVNREKIEARLADYKQVKGFNKGFKL